MGLGIRDVSNRVLISKIDPDSISDGKLMLRDQIIDVDGKRVSNKDVTRELIIISLKVSYNF